jgi:tetratricopeptide (TPR) repeat protein
VVLSTEEQRRYEYFFLEAVRLEQQERYDEAFEMITHCLSIAPEAPSALYKVATYYFFLNRKEMALEALSKAVEGEPNNYWYKQTLASYYQTNREYDKAIAVLEEMQRLFPKRNGELLTALVGLYSHTQQYDKVVDALERLEQLMGKSEAISMEKSRNYLLMGNKESAFGELEALAAEYPESSYYRVILSSMYMEHGRMPDALPLLQEVVLKLPKKGESLDDLIQVGCVGLLKAIDQYNESTGEEFDHFAEFMITKEIKRYLRID